MPKVTQPLGQREIDDFEILGFCEINIHSQDEMGPQILTVPGHLGLNNPHEGSGKGPSVCPSHSALFLGWKDNDPVLSPAVGQHSLDGSP